VSDSFYPLDRGWRRLRWPVVFFAIAAPLFLLVNRASYRGFFYGDDLSTLAWAKTGEVPVFLGWLVSPRLNNSNFRPVGAFYYRVLGGSIGFWFPPYVAVLQVIHLANVIALYLLLQRLKLPPLSCAAGAAFFLFHIATVDAYWKPMYVFDLLCGSFCLLTLLLYTRGNWLLGLVTFWLAFKSKEVAVMLPLVLAAYELLIGNRYWRRLIPYFLISLNFGLQGLRDNTHFGTPYELRLTHGDFATSLQYYATELFLNPYFCVLLLIVLVLARDRRVFFGFLAMLFLLFPMLPLPGRLFGVYWYVPLIGASVMLAALCASSSRWLVCGALACWLLGNYALLRQKQQVILTAARDNRTYFDSLAAFARRHPDIRVFGYENFPDELYVWGVEGSVSLLFGYDRRVYPASSQEFDDAARQSKSCVLTWEQGPRQLVISYPAVTEAQRYSRR
jgi:hypothetical protein